jgi:predicted  nucleic acid-binding Zn-ribbon protein
LTQAALAQLQLLDTEMDALRKRHGEVERLMADRSQVELKEAEEREASAHVSESRTMQRDRELELTALEARIAELERRLYSGRIHNTKELESLSNESQMFKDHKLKLEEKVLGLMDDTERAERVAQAAQQRAEAARGERARTEQAWAAELDRLRTELDALEAQAASVRPRVVPEHLDTYDRMRRRSGLVVVKVRGQNCGACGVELSARVLEQARDDNLLPTCDNCGRVLRGE